MKKIQKRIVAATLALASTVALTGCVILVPVPFPFPSSVPGPTHTDPPFDFEELAAKNLVFAKTLVGVGEQEAIDSIIANGFSYRVVSRDGEDFAVTMDYRVDRINLTTVKLIVTEVSVG